MKRHRTTKVSAQEKRIRAALDRAAQEEAARDEKQRKAAVAAAKEAGRRAIKAGGATPEFEAKIAKVEAIRPRYPLLPLRAPKTKPRR